MREVWHTPRTGLDYPWRGDVLWDLSNTPSEKLEQSARWRRHRESPATKGAPGGAEHSPVRAPSMAPPVMMN